ncbi:MAG: putative tricarboxylic transport rane protein [Clostridiales bacterium]|jgi:tripartite-type tricarboxylate transporter receptor subunit TctC|nr:putative tricarboxylic transport rane protein [Clostridiales bacterium]
MMKGLKKLFALATIGVMMVTTACSGSGSSTGSSTQTEYPTKTITMVIPYGAGGTTDLTGRQFAIQLEKELGQSITVVNQAGASGSVGAKTVLDAEPDGYTIFYTADTLGTQRVMGLSDMGYDDFTPIMAVVNDPKVIVVGKDSPYETINDLVDDMIARPGKVKMSYTGPGGSGHVQALIYNKLGLDMALTAYTSGSDCIVAVLGGQVDFTNSNYSTIASYLESGDLKMLAVSSNEKLPQYPDVPTLSEVIPEAEPYLDIPFTPLSLVVDKDVPQEVVDVLKEAAKKAVQEQDWIDFVNENNLEKLYEKYPDEASILQFYADWQSNICWLLYDAGAAPNSPEQYGISRP